MSSPQKEWTIMVYMAGDNNLSEDMIRALFEIKGGLDAWMMEPLPGGTNPGDCDQVGFVAQYDCSHPIVRTGRYNLNVSTDPDNNIPPGDIATTSVAIEKFVQWAIQVQPARNYALVLSGHSDGFMSRTILMDADPTSIIQIGELKQCLARCASHLPKKKFDVVAFDSCVMNSLEVMYEFRRVADVWLGSQGSIPNYAWDYRRIAYVLRRTPISRLTSRYLTDTVCESLKEFNKQYALGGRSIDVSAISLNTGQFDTLLANVDALALLLIELLYENGAIELVMPEFTENYNEVQRLVLFNHWRGQMFMWNQCADLRDFCFCLKVDSLKLLKEIIELVGIDTGNQFRTESLTEDEITFLHDFVSNNSISPVTREKVHNLYRLYLACHHVTVSVGQLVIRGSYVGSDSRFSKGVSIFFPWTFVAYLMALQKYESLEFWSTKKNNWRNFIYFFGIFSMRFGPDELRSVELKTLNFQQLLDLLLQQLGGPDNRDSPPHNRGLEEYYYYFGQIRNIHPNLKVSGDFS